MPKSVKVAQTNELCLGSGKVIEADSRSIALFDMEDTFYVMENICTRRGGPLGIR